MFKGTNKMQEQKEVKVSEAKTTLENETTNKYFFPDSGMTVRAHSFEEAKSILNKIINK